MLSLRERKVATLRNRARHYVIVFNSLLTGLRGQIRRSQGFNRNGIAFRRNRRVGATSIPGGLHHEYRFGETEEIGVQDLPESVFCGPPGRTSCKTLVIRWTSRISRSRMPDPTRP